MKYVPPFGPPGTVLPDASYINGDPNISRKGSIPPAEAMEHPQREIVNTITDAQQVPNELDLHQLAKSIRDGKLQYCLDTGPLNQLEVTIAGPPITAYSGGLTLRVLVAHTNTGPVTIAVGSVNSTAVKRRDGAELHPGDIVAGQIATLVCDGTYFQLQNLGVSDSSPGAPTIYQVDIPYVRDTSANANHLLGAYSPPLADIKEGRTVEIKLANNINGPTDFIPNNFPIHNVVHPDGTPLGLPDGLVAGQIVILIFDGTNWQLIGSRGAPVVTVPVVVGKSLEFIFNNYFPGPLNTMSMLRRSPSMNTNRQIWAMSMFLKRTNLTNGGNISQVPFSAGGGQSGSDYTGPEFSRGDYGDFFRLFWNNSSGPVAPGGAGSFANPTMNDMIWHHWLLTADGAHISCTVDTVLVSQGPISGNGAVNSTRPHCIGADSDDLGSWYGCSMLMAEIQFVDGLAPTWDKFAIQSGGVMKPKNFSGAWGINGCYLNWADSSAATTTTLGKDWSGNGNNWQPVNISIGQVSTDYPR
jgi:hypothetical protein